MANDEPFQNPIPETPSSDPFTDWNARGPMRLRVTKTEIRYGFTSLSAYAADPNRFLELARGRL